MKDNYSSPEEIRTDFGIAETELPEIRSKLRSMQGMIHPDKNAGAFASNEDKERFHQLNKAIEYIDNQGAGASLVPISAVTDLTRAVTELARSQSSSTYLRLSEQVSNSIESYRSRFRIPKIALSAISAAIAAIWIFPETVKNHPVLSNWFDFSRPENGIIWVIVFLFTIIFWIFAWSAEERQKSFQESLKTELVQNRLFSDFLTSLAAPSFTLEDFVHFLITKNRTNTRLSAFLTKTPLSVFLTKTPLSALFGPTRGINLTLAHTIAEIVIERAVKRKAVLYEDNGKISLEYRVTNRG